MKDSYFLLRLLQANRQQLEKLLGRDWPAFLDLLESTLDSFLHGPPMRGYSKNIRDIIEWVTRDAGERAADILRDVVQSVPTRQALPPGEIEVALPGSKSVVLTVPEDIPAGRIKRAEVVKEAEGMMREILVRTAAAPPRQGGIFEPLPPQEPDPGTKSPAHWGWDWREDPIESVGEHTKTDSVPLSPPFSSEESLAPTGGYRGPLKEVPAAERQPTRSGFTVPGEEKREEEKPEAEQEEKREEEPEDRRINVWVAERDSSSRRPLRPQEPYTLCFQIAQPRASSLVSGPQTLISAADIPDAGLETEWMMVSTDVDFLPSGPDVQVSETAGSVTARFTLQIPKGGDSDLRKVAIRTRSAGPARVSAVVFAIFPGGRRERYRELELTLTVSAKMQVDSPVVQTEEEQVVAARHLGLRTTHEWTTPWGELTITVSKTGLTVFVNADYDAKQIDNEEIETPWDAKKLAGRIANVRTSAERFRAKWESYLNDIDPASLPPLLQSYRFNADSNWSQLQNLAGPDHQAVWEKVKVSPELRDMAVDGYSLYQALFPRASELRGWMDALPPGARFEISWRDGEVSNIPLSLLYRNPAPQEGAEVDPTDFLGLRYRIAYTAHKTSTRASSKALGSPAVAHQTSFLYWGDHPADTTGAEARWQRNLWSGLDNQVIVPAVDSADRRRDLLRLWNDPDPSPMAVLYFFCQCKVGDGNDPVLSFGDAAADILRRTDLAGEDLEDRPLVFANACTTASADPYLSNELEATFFERGCRAFLGTETKVPIPMAARFASIFFEFFYRRVDPQPMAAGEALAQSRIFLWTRYRNIGGLFYTYINQYELFLADDAEVAALRA